MGAPINQLSGKDTADLASRLAALEGLRLPAQLTRGEEPPSFGRKQEYLNQLVLHDPGVFLERHGECLTPSELLLFEPLRAGSYEVDFYVRLLQAPADPQGSATTVRNRRLAAMNRLISEGQHFSDEAMREREPFLYHQYIGQYEEGAVPPEDGAEPAGRHEGMLPDSLSAILLESHDKKERAGRRDAEEERYAMIEEETESDEEEEAAGMHERPATSAAAAAEAAEQALSPEERAESAAAYKDLMQQRFLHGLDPAADYATIDADAGLDEDWADQQDRDAQDHYFDSD